MLSSTRNDIKTSGDKSYYYSIDLIGNTLKDLIYLDFLAKGVQVNNTTRYVNEIELIPITENCPIGRKTPLNRYMRTEYNNFGYAFQQQPQLYINGNIENYENNTDYQYD